jgi:hypothetical protein
MGGFVTVVYAPDAYLGSASNGTNLYSLPTANWTTQSLENYPYIREFDGSQHIMLQWFPNEYETALDSASDSLTKPNSGFYGYINSPLNNSVSYHVEFDYGIEYVPTVAYRPYVDLDQPTTHYDALYYLNLFNKANWNKTVITTYQEYLSFASSIDHIKGSLFKNYALNSTIGLPVSLPQQKRMEKEAHVTEERFCETIDRMTGLDACGVQDDITDSLWKTGSQILLKDFQIGGRPNMIGY